MLGKRHIISATDLSADELLGLFRRAQAFQEMGGTRWNILKGRMLANVFYEASTRTFSSFDIAMKQLGGDTIPIHDAARISSAAKGESLKDMLRMFEGYFVDGIVVRHPSDDELAYAVEGISVPVINAGSGKKEHPTQAFLDFYTIWSAVQNGRFNRYGFGSREQAPISVTFFGDNARSRTVRSLALLLAAHAKDFGIKIQGVDFVGPEHNASPPEDVLTALKDAAISSTVRGPEAQILSDIVYITRSQKERGGENGDQVEVDQVEVFSQERLDLLFKESMLLHPLPRNEELPEAFDADPRAWYFKQAQNGLFVRMALLEMLIGGR